MDFIKIKNLYFSKNTVKKMHSQAIDKEKIFTIYIYLMKNLSPATQ